MAESFFSRLRRAEVGTHHHIAGPYLASYAAEMAWREDNRRTSNGAQAGMVLEAAMDAPVSRLWAGHWQRAAWYNVFFMFRDVLGENRLPDLTMIILITNRDC